jgi:prepilin-type N-terminal cleavage/methylation domain-containing protein
VETNMQNNIPSSVENTSRRGQAGFSLLEMLVAMIIVTVGLLGVASSIGYALMASNSGRGITNAKLLVVSALEQMESLRDTGQLNFDEISNAAVTGSTFPGFSTSFLPVSTVPGPDGIYGTGDDLSTDPGVDGIYGTSDDVTDQTLVVKGATRQVVITSLSPTLKKIQVTLRYSANGGSTRDLVGVSYLNDDAHGNYVP